MTSGSRASIRLVLADDHPVVLAGLAKFFATEPGFEVVACARDGDEALGAVRSQRPDVLLLDIRMPRKDGLHVLRELKSEKLLTRVVVLTAVEGGDVIEAICLGARGVVSKDTEPERLVAGIRAVHKGDRWFDDGTASQAFEKLIGSEQAPGADRDSLTPREVDIAGMIVSGLHTKAIANRLSISEGTAKVHLHNVYEKLRVDGRIGLIRYMLTHGPA